MSIGKAKGSMLVAAMLGSTAGAQMTDTPNKPIRLESVVEGTTVVIRVIGDSDVAITANYMLEVASGATSNSNRTVQRGSAKLLPNTPVVLLATRLGGNAAGNWRARLEVSGAGMTYQMEGAQAAPPAPAQSETG